MAIGTFNQSVDEFIHSVDGWAEQRDAIIKREESWGGRRYPPDRDSHEIYQGLRESLSCHKDRAIHTGHELLTFLIAHGETKLSVEVQETVNAINNGNLPFIKSIHHSITARLKVYSLELSAEKQAIHHSPVESSESLAQQQRVAFERLPPRIKAAFEAFSKGKQELESERTDPLQHITDKMVHDHLKADGTPMDDFETWRRYLSEARNKLGISQTKHSSTRPRPQKGRSTVGQEHVQSRHTE